MLLLKRRPLIVLLVSLLLGAAGALMYDVENVNIIAFPNETLEYSLNITNNDSATQHVYINKIFIDNTFIGREVSVEPAVNIWIDPNESQVVNISIPVSEELAIGVYRTLYRTKLFISYSGVTDSLLLDAVIMSRAIEPIEVQNITIIAPDSVDPRDEFNFTATLLCNAGSISPVIRVLISNSSSIVYESTIIKDLSYGINLFDMNVKLLDKTYEGLYQVLVSAELAGEVITQGASDLMVESYTIIDYSSVTSEDLFGKGVLKVFVNGGTEAVNVSLNYSASLLEPLLINRALLTIRQDGVIVSSQAVPLVDYLISEVVLLQPDQSVELTVELNYGLLLLIPFIVILSLVGWALLTKKVRVVKEIIQCKQDGGEIVVKVGISVKNVSLKSINEVKIVEDLPLFAKKAGSFGSIKGDIDRKKGIINFWVGRLDPKEEVLISYKFKTDVELVGRVSLPPVTIKYRCKDTKVHIAKSSTPVIHLIKGGQ